MSNKLRFLFAAMLPVVVWAQHPDTTLLRKAVYQDYLFLNSIERGSHNPTSIMRESLSNVAQVQASYSYTTGDFRAMDDADIQKTFDFSLYGIKKFKRVSYEGLIAYQNDSQRERRYNSTLYVSPDNPFIIADSIRSNFLTERFHLNGGFAYNFTPDFCFGLRADYQVGTTANQTDPRPKVDGMRFKLNPGLDYQWNAFTIGLSGHYEWMSESCEYTVLRSTEQTYYTFLFHGIVAPTMKTAIGYQRKYTGSSTGAQIQLTWKGSTMQNFLEASFETDNEESEDGGSAEKYKGGKYKATQFGSKNRFLFTHNSWNHNLILEAQVCKVDGTSYEQKQHATSDGNVVWDVLSQSICHKNNYMNASLLYRMDKLNQLQIPHLTLGIKGGMQVQEVKHYPEIYKQKYTLAYAELFAKKFFQLKKYTIGIQADVAYKLSLSDDSQIEGSLFDIRYTEPQFAYASADACSGKVRIDVQRPLSIRKFQSNIGGYVECTHSAYMGDKDYYKDSSRSVVQAGVHLIF